MMKWLVLLTYNIKSLMTPHFKKSTAHLKVLVRVTRNATGRRALTVYRTFSQKLPSQNVFRVKSGGKAPEIRSLS
ncbi:hypothetical protein CEXT_442961 [Caerostris extrusa]|uniref:Ribosomal protein L33 n=1 Tax=Caerostris extrusa TaxID=172846 RepID=A0AAV4NTD7_CAEEX|nr:hypothetical protein CEXT_442961 [Caerostris extrusa]